MQRFRFLAVLTLAFLAFPALAQDTGGVVEQVKVPGFGQIAYQHLFTATSETGETLDAFVLRIAPRLRAFSDETGFEACASLASDGERFGAVVGTNLGHTVCVNFHAKVPQGMAFTGETVHSHTHAARYRANKSDRLVLGPSTRLGQVVHGGNPDEFSDEDYAAPGYMVSTGQVLHQSGKGTERVVGAL